MKKLTICFIIGLAIYSLFISINYNKLKLENININQEVKNLNENIDELNIQNESLNENIGKLNSENEKLNEDIEELKSQNENLKSILNVEKYEYYLVDENLIYLINKDRFIHTFDLPNILLYSGTEELIPQIINNPIDEYNHTIYKTVYATSPLLTELNKVRDLWFEEIDYTLNQLKKYLSEEKYNELIQIQESWKDYVENEYRYHTRNYYDSVLQKLEVTEVFKDKVRQRALDLMVYLYEFQDDADFYYNKEKN